MYEINVETLRKGISNIVAIVEEGILNILSEGFSVKTVDVANVAMVVLNLDKSAFTAYENEEEIKIGIDFSRLLSILSNSKNDESVKIEIDTDKQKLNAQIGNLNYSQSLLDVSSVRREPQVPELEFSTTVELESAILQQATRAASRISDIVVIGTEKDDSFYIQAEGEMDKIILELDKDELIDIKGETARSLYSMSYITEIAKYIYSGTVTLNMKSDYPLQTEFSYDDVSVAYLLAPRIE